MKQVFVTVGNAPQQFHRLLDAVSAATSSSLRDLHVVVQRGSNAWFENSQCEIINYVPPGEFQARIAAADVVISHAGAGTLLTVLGAGKLPVVMPRLRRYGEHVDDHQLELVTALGVEGRVVPLFDPADLDRAVATAVRTRCKRSRAAVSLIYDLIGAALAEYLAVDRA